MKPNEWKEEIRELDGEGFGGVIRYYLDLIYNKGFIGKDHSGLKTDLIEYLLITIIGIEGEVRKEEREKVMKVLAQTAKKGNHQTKLTCQYIYLELDKYLLDKNNGETE